MTLADDLRAARSLIDTPEKWCRNEFFKGNACCILGAGQKATGRNAVDFEYYKALSVALPASFVPDDSNWDGAVPQFNDDPATTHADIMALFDRAIAKAEEQNG